MRDLEGVRLDEFSEDILYRVERGLTDGMTAWLSPAIKRREDSRIHGVGSIAVRDVGPGSLLAVKQGFVLDEETIKQHADIIQGTHQQIGQDIFIAGLTPAQVDKNKVPYNHGCLPTARIQLVEGRPIALVVAREGIEAGDEVTVDYGVSFDSATQFIPECMCHNEAECRGVIDPTKDWMNPDFQARYPGEFPAWIQQKIDRLVAADLVIQG